MIRGESPTGANYAVGTVSYLASARVTKPSTAGSIKAAPPRPAYFCLTRLCRSIYHSPCLLHQNAGLRHLVQARGFYGELDDVDCPTKSITSGQVCCGDFRHAKRLRNVWSTKLQEVEVEPSDSPRKCNPTSKWRMLSGLLTMMRTCRVMNPSVTEGAFLLVGFPTRQHSGEIPHLSWENRAGHSEKLWYSVFNPAPNLHCS